jgi:hypothetical protein
MTEQWMNEDVGEPQRTIEDLAVLRSRRDGSLSKRLASSVFGAHELRVDRDGMLVYCPCGWAYTFSYVPAGEDISFAYRAHLEGL